MWDVRDSRTGMPALPYCKVRLKGTFKPPGYPNEINNLGDHLRKRRLDLGLRQRAVAKALGADATSVANWELGHSKPALRFLPAIIRFLGCDPRPEPRDLGKRLRWFREGKGRSQEDLARRLGVDPSSVAGWEAGRRKPSPRLRAKVTRFLSSQIAPPD